jgi:RimJ/RimL family protein N-acetyltransferase
MVMVIRETKPHDAEGFNELMRKVESEAEYMMMEPGERTITSEQRYKWLEQIEKADNSTVLVAENENRRLVGYLVAMGGGAKRTRHTAYLVIGILSEYTGQGIGTKLFKTLDEWARTQNILRLELTVVVQNKAGVALYKKMGFVVEGIKRNSLLLNGSLIDQYYMAKLY